MEEMLNGQSIDGIDHWHSLMESEESPRTEMLYNIDPSGNDNKESFINAGIRVGNYKLLLGNPGDPNRAISTREVVDVDLDDTVLGRILMLFYSDEILCDQVRLYDLSVDPNEQNNLAKEMPGEYQPILLIF